jgi:hypothetical protein
MDMQSEKGRVGAIFIRQNGHFLAWSMLEGLCLWAQCTLMHMHREMGRVATMYTAKPVIFRECFINWKDCSFGLCVYCDAHAE